MNVVAGLHQRLRHEPRLVAMAADRGLRLFDVRDPPADLSVGKGYPRAGRRLLTIGTDCSVQGCTRRSRSPGRSVRAVSPPTSSDGRPAS